MASFQQALKAKQDIESMHNELQSLMAWSQKQKQRDKSIEDARGKRQPEDAAVTRSIDEFAESSTVEAARSTKQPAPKHNRSSFSLLPKSGKRTKPVHSNAAVVNTDTGTSAAGPSQPATPRITPEVRAPTNATIAEKASSPSAASPATAAAANADSAAEADKLRECGNMNFRKGNYEEANAAYSASIAARPGALALSNRAMVALKMERWLKAEEDATAALAHDESFCKAWQRRAAARIKIGGLSKVLQAVEDLEQAIRLQPESSVLAAERAAAVVAYHKLPGATSQPSVWRPIRIVESTTAATATSNRSVKNAEQEAQQQQQQQQQQLAATLKVGTPSSAPLRAERCTTERGSSSPTERAAELKQSRPKAQPDLQQQHTQQQQRQQQQQLMRGCEIEEIVEPLEETLEEDHLPSSAAAAAAAAAAVDSLQSSNEQSSKPSIDALPEVQSPAPSRSPASAPVEAHPSPSAAAALNSTTVRAVSAQVDQQPSVEERSGDEAQQALPLSAATRTGSNVDPGMVSSSSSAAAEGASVSATTAAAARGVSVPATTTAAAAAAAASTAAAVQQTDSMAVARNDGSPVAAAAVAALLKQLGAPKTGTDFERTWRMLSHHPECQAGYLAKIEPAALPQLLRTQLTAPLLESLLLPLLEAIRDDAAAASPATHALKILAVLPDVPRFALAVMLVSSPQRQTLSDKWEAAVAAVAQTEATNTDATDVKQLLRRLRATFRL